MWKCASLVNEKLKQFVIVLQRNNIINVYDAIKAIRESDAFNNASIVDCELLTYAVNDVLHDTYNK